MRLAGPAGTRTGRGTSLAARTRGRLAAAAILVATALAGTTMVGVPAASASSTETVIVTSTGLLSPVAAVLDVLGTVLTRFHIIDGVEASIPAALAPVLDALPGITVTPDVSVSVQSDRGVDRAARALRRVPAADRRHPAGRRTATPARASPWPCSIPASTGCPTSPGA